MLLDMSYIYHFMKGIFTQERRVVPFHSLSVVILAEIPKQVKGDSQSAVCASYTMTATKSTFFLIYKNKWLPPMSDIPILVRSTRNGIMMIQSQASLVRRRLALYAIRVMEFVSYEPF